MAADPAQSAKDLLGSWEENPFGPEVVVPITACSDRDDWKDCLLYDRGGGLRSGELEGVTFSDGDGPDSLLFAGRGLQFAITPDCSESANRLFWRSRGILARLSFQVGAASTDAF